MKTRGFILVFFSALTFSLTAQNVDDILNLIERNNTTLQASRQMAEAEKIANRTGLAPSNPAVDFAYLWGNPEAIGNRISFSVKQEFDFPSAYVYRNDMSKLKNEQAELNYEKTRQSILLETRLLCYELLYHNAVHAELEQRVQYAVKIVEAYKKSF
jgi:outer membrane protein TolC